MRILSPKACKTPRISAAYRFRIYSVSYYIILRCKIQALTAMFSIVLSFSRKSLICGLFLRSSPSLKNVSRETFIKTAHNTNTDMPRQAKPFYRRSRRSCYRCASQKPSSNRSIELGFAGFIQNRSQKNHPNTSQAEPSNNRTIANRQPRAIVVCKQPPHAVKLSGNHSPKQYQQEHLSVRQLRALNRQPKRCFT